MLFLLPPKFSKKSRVFQSNQSGIALALIFGQGFVQNRIAYRTNVQSILVVDDDYAMRRGIALTLKGNGYDVYEAQGRRDALQIVSERNIDLALIDLYLDHDDGMTIADSIREQRPGMKFVILTAHAERERAQLAQQMYKHNFLEKALLEERLLKKIEDVLGPGEKGRL